MLSAVLLIVEDSVIPVDDHPVVVVSPLDVEVLPTVDVAGGVELSVKPPVEVVLV